MTLAKLRTFGPAWAAAMTLLLLAGYATYAFVIEHPIATVLPRRGTAATSFFPHIPSGVSPWSSPCWRPPPRCVSGRCRKDWPILLLPLLAVVLTCHLGALAAVLIQGTAALAVGIPIYRRLRGPNAPDDASLTGTILAWFAGGSVNAYLAWIAFHWTVNYDYVYCGVLLAEILLLQRPLTEVARAAFRRASASGWRPGQWVIVLSAVILFPVVLIPLYGYDDLVRHLFFRSKSRCSVVMRLIQVFFGRWTRRCSRRPT